MTHDEGHPVIKKQSNIETARALWVEKIQPRIKHMSNQVSGTHAQYCIADIASALAECEKKAQAALTAKLEACEQERDNLRLRIQAVDAEHADMERQKHKSIEGET